MLSFSHSHWVMHLQGSCAAAELLWLRLCSRQEVCLSLSCAGLRCWIMFSMGHCCAISLLECLMAGSSSFHWIELSLIFFFSKNKIGIGVRRWQIKNYQKYLIPAGNQRCIWFDWYLLSNRGKNIHWPLPFLVHALKHSDLLHMKCSSKWFFLLKKPVVQLSGERLSFRLSKC